MNVIAIKAWHYTVTLDTPLVIKNSTITERQGFFIGLLTDTHCCGLGEVAPLPGLNTDTLETCHAAFQTILPSLHFLAVPTTIQLALDKLSEINQHHTVPIPVQHGLEMALLHLMSSHAKKPIATLLNTNAHHHIHLHGLLTGDLEAMTHTYQRLTKSGFTKFKIKTGQLNEKEECHRLNTFFKLTEPHHHFWLDSNRQWPLSVAVSICNKLKALPLLYVEEAVELPSELTAFHTKTTRPIGIDETIIDDPHYDIKTLSGLNTIVIKPSAIGLHQLHRIYHSIQDTPIDIAISSAYESPLSHRYYCHLSAAFSKTHSLGIDANLNPNHSLYQNPDITIAHLSLPHQHDLIKNATLSRWLL